MKNGFVPFSRSSSLDGEYFRVRYKLLGKEGYIEFVREEAPYWEQPRNLLIAKNVFLDMSGEELPEVSKDEILKAQQRKIAELEKMVQVQKEKKEEPAKQDVDMSERVHSVTQAVGRGRAKQS